MAHKKKQKEALRACAQCVYRPHWTCENPKAGNYDEMIPSTNPACKKFQDKSKPRHS